MRIYCCLPSSLPDLVNLRLGEAFDLEEVLGQRHIESLIVADQPWFECEEGDPREHLPQQSGFLELEVWQCRSHRRLD